MLVRRPMFQNSREATVVVQVGMVQPMGAREEIKALAALATSKTMRTGRNGLTMTMWLRPSTLISAKRPLF
jgi:hypothetical protein